MRPGGLRSKLRQGEAAGGVIMARPGTFGFPPLQQSGSILRSQVCATRVCVVSRESSVCVCAHKFVHFLFVAQHHLHHGAPATPPAPPLCAPLLQVADVCVEALVCPAAEGKVVEVIADKDAVAQPLGQLFEAVRMGGSW